MWSANRAVNRLCPTSRTGRSSAENVDRLVTAEASTLAASSRRRFRMPAASSVIVPVAGPAGESTSTSQVPGVLPARISISRSLPIVVSQLFARQVVTPGQDHREVGVGTGVSDESPGVGMQVDPERERDLVGLLTQSVQLADHSLYGGLDPPDSCLEGHLRALGHCAAVHP